MDNIHTHTYNYLGGPRVPGNRHLNSPVSSVSRKRKDPVHRTEHENPSLFRCPSVVLVKVRVHTDPSPTQDTRYTSLNEKWNSYLSVVSHKPSPSSLNVNFY